MPMGDAVMYRLSLYRPVVCKCYYSRLLNSSRTILSVKTIGNAKNNAFSTSDTVVIPEKGHVSVGDNRKTTTSKHNTPHHDSANELNTMIANNVIYKNNKHNDQTEINTSDEESKQLLSNSVRTMREKLRDKYCLQDTERSSRYKHIHGKKYTNFVSEEKHADSESVYFGLHGLEDEIFTTKYSQTSVVEKAEYVNEPNNFDVVQRRMEKIITMPYGDLRLDSQQEIYKDKLQQTFAGNIKRGKREQENVNSLQPNNTSNSSLHSQLKSKQLSTEYSNKNHLLNGDDEKSNIFDEQYFSDISKFDKDPSEQANIPYVNKYRADASPLPEIKTTKAHSSMKESISAQKREKQNLFDQQYFADINHDNYDVETSQEKIDIAPLTKQIMNPREDLTPRETTSQKSNFFDEQFFFDETDQQIEESQLAEKNCTLSSTSLIGNVTSPSNSFKNESAHSNCEISFNDANTSTISPALEHNTNEATDVFVSGETQQQKRLQNLVKPNVENPETAYDMAMKLRKELKVMAIGEMPAPRDAKWKGRVDSHGFRILTDQILELNNKTKDVVVRILRDSIIFQNGSTGLYEHVIVSAVVSIEPCTHGMATSLVEKEQLIAIDKPYGLASHGGPGIHHSIGQLLDLLTQSLPSSKRPEGLYLVHRLDKETTGVMLLANLNLPLSSSSTTSRELLSQFRLVVDKDDLKSPQVAYFLREKFKKREVTKKYLCITKGVPNPLEGVIDIKLGEGTVGHKRRMALRPIYNPEMKLLFKTGGKNGQEAVTNYRVIDSNHNAALVECQPLTGLKHQIRCHLAFALNTPILGDHKYSHFTKIAPQKLHPDILQRLGIRQTKVRHLAMHLHASELIIPELLDGRNLFLKTHLPRHFTQNMKWLKLNIK